MPCSEEASRIPAPPSGQPDPARDEQEKPLVQFVSFVLDDVQNTWTQVLPQQTGTPYHHAKLVLFRDAIDSGCGGAQSATGPFYCPEDEKVYIDLGFFDELSQRFGAPGQFAQAYVLAHELGHHVQKLLGIEARVQQLQERDNSEANPLSVKLELQADCFAGVWAHTTQQRGLLEKGDVESALGAASAVGDDRLQKMATGRVNPRASRMELHNSGCTGLQRDWIRGPWLHATLLAQDNNPKLFRNHLLI